MNEGVMENGCSAVGPRWLHSEMLDHANPKAQRYQQEAGNVNRGVKKKGRQFEQKE